MLFCACLPLKSVFVSNWIIASDMNLHVIQQYVRIYDVRLLPTVYPYTVANFLRIQSDVAFVLYV